MAKEKEGPEKVGKDGRMAFIVFDYEEAVGIPQKLYKNASYNDLVKGIKDDEDELERGYFILSNASLPNPITGKNIMLPDGSSTFKALGWAAVGEEDNGLRRSSAGVYYWEHSTTPVVKFEDGGATLYSTTKISPTSLINPVTLVASTETLVSVLTVGFPTNSSTLRLSNSIGPIDLNVSTISSQSVLTLGFSTAAPGLRLSPASATNPITLYASTESSQSVFTISYNTAAPKLRLTPSSGQPLDFILSTESSQSVLTLTWGTLQPRIRISPADIEMGNASYIAWRDAADSAYLEAISVNSADALLLGTNTDMIRLFCNGECMSIQNLETVVNDLNFAYDFRVEGDTKTHLLYVDGTDDRVGINQSSPEAILHVTQSTVGNEVFRIESTATNDDPADRFYHGRVATTNATITTINTISIPASTTVYLEAHVRARRTGGVAGTAEDGAGYCIKATYKNAAGTATIIGAVLADYTAEDQAGWDATFNTSGGNVLLQVTGAADNNVSWHSTVIYRAVGS